MGKASVLPPSGAFLQATEAGEAALVAAMQEAVAGAKRVADLFAGCGTFALPLAAQAEVHAVEGEAEMLKALDAGWRFATGLKTVSTEARDLFRRPLVPLELKQYDAVVIDPPRAGAAAQMSEIAASNIRLVGAVSCNPISFARDAKTLIDAGFTLDWVQPVDQFRWSGHVELAAKFSR
jgi:23S rRNA (uracil1939-C5)-methyltransferase